MRLSDIRGARVFEVMADLVEPMANIAGDEAFAEATRGGDVKKHVPALIRGHKDDLAAIMAALEGVDKEQYLETLDLPKFIEDVYTVITDKGLLDFFTSFDAIEGLSGSRSERTEGQD